MPIVKANDIDLYYEDSGRGQPLLLIQGLGLDHRPYRRLAEELRHHFRVIAFDNRGVGLSHKPKGPYTAWQMADDAAGLLDALGVERASLMGVSFGGNIAQAFALRHGGRLDRLVLGCTFCSGRPEKVKTPPRSWRLMIEPGGTVEEITRRALQVMFSEAFIRERPDVLEDLVAWRKSRPVPFRGFNGQLQALLSFDVEDRVAALTHEVLILHGDEDRVIPVERARELHAAVRGSRLRIFRGAGHLFFIERPGETAEAVVEFLARG